MFAIVLMPTFVGLVDSEFVKFGCPTLSWTLRPAVMNAFGQEMTYIARRMLSRTAYKCIVTLFVLECGYFKQITNCHSEISKLRQIMTFLKHFVRYQCLKVFTSDLQSNESMD